MNRRGGLHLTMLIFVPLVAFAACTTQQEREATTERTDTTFQTAEQRDDTSLTTAVQARLYSDDMLRGQNIDVRVENGVATLSGTVDAAATEQQALSTARGVDGIVSVEDQLMVAQEQRAEGQQPQGAMPTTGVDERNPGWITTKIQAQYFVDADVKPWNIDVTTTSGGIVELRGEVESAEAKAEAVRIARSTEGVTRVDDHLRVRSTDARTGTAAPADDTARGSGDADRGTDLNMSDPWLTAKIQSKYFLDTDVKGRDIDVTAQNGVVTLRGTVESERERRQAVALATNTDGVLQVQDELQVGAGGAANARPNEAESREPARGTAGTNVIAGVEDVWITTKIQSQYFLDQEVKGHEINVDTRNGVVTLTGSVEADARKQLAEQIARETDGVNRVVNRLTVSAAGQNTGGQN